MIRGTHPLLLEIQGVENAAVARDRLRRAQREAAGIEDARERGRQVRRIGAAIREAKERREECLAAALAIHADALEREARLLELVEDLNAEVKRLRRETTMA